MPNKRQKLSHISKVKSLKKDLDYYLRSSTYTQLFDVLWGYMELEKDMGLTFKKYKTQLGNMSNSQSLAFGKSLQYIRPELRNGDIL